MAGATEHDDEPRRRGRERLYRGGARDHLFRGFVYEAAARVDGATCYCDVMTFKGMVLGIARFASRRCVNRLMLASFKGRRPPLRGVHGRTDAIVGVSECIIMGTSPCINQIVATRLVNHPDSLVGLRRARTGSAAARSSLLDSEYPEERRQKKRPLLRRGITSAKVIY